ncbi:hypothetical protein OY671_009939, partial [Metschnikowia pulcherrima]
MQHKPSPRAARGRSAAGASAALASLDTISAERWRRSSSNAIEPNGYYSPEWESAVNASAQGRTNVSALAASADAVSANDTPRQIGSLPVISAWRAYNVPSPALVSADPYGTSATPSLDRDQADEAAADSMQQARNAGAHASISRDIPLDGAAMMAFTRALASNGLKPRISQSH